MATLRFDGRVAVVTGAGGGLGRAYALALAARGASVVVNDLGGDRHGAGASASAADLVVQEITKAGGKAVANYDSVVEGEKIVKSALDAFGRVDIVINNAGILRDKSFARTSDTDWDLVHQVHLKGSFAVTRAAWPHMQKQKYGRIVMTSSAAGVYGNYGQANYSAAKLGLLGLSNTLAIEGAKYNIHCNTVVPTAGSRLTETVMPPNLVQALKPEFIAPIVLFLCHESCEDTHGVFETSAGWVSKLRWERTAGVLLPEPTPEAVRDNWDAISDWSSAEHPSTIQDAMAAIMQQMSKRKQGVSVAPTRGEGFGVDYKRAMAFKFQPGTYEVTPDKVALYALGVGASMPADLNLLYENHSDFAALPSLAVIPAQVALSQLGANEGLKFHPMKLLHGEQFVKLHRPFPTEGKLISQPRMVDVLDKGKGALVVINVDTTTTDGQLVATNQFNVFLRGVGGFGGPSTSAAVEALSTTPAGAPDAVVQDKTRPDQAALYRLSGDKNPLHIDPDLARMGGFDQPILHGLCSLGFAVRQIVQRYCNNDPRKLTTIKARFSAPVMPGETLETSMWKQGDKVLFQSRVVERNVVVLAGGYVVIQASKAQQAAHQRQATREHVSTVRHMPTASPQLKAASFFDQLQGKVTPQLVAKTKAVFQWNITKDGKPAGKWTVDLKNGNGSVYEGAAKTKAGCTLTVDDDDLLALVSGKLDPMKAFMGGKLKVSGNLMLAQKLQGLFAATSDAAASAAAKTPSKVSSTAGSVGLKSSQFFDQYAKRLSPELVKKAGAIFQWNITKDGRQAAQWTVDLKNGSGEVYTGPAKSKAGCVLTVSDDDFADLVSGKLPGMDAFMSGKLKVTGNLMLAQKLGSLFKLSEDAKL